MRNYTPINEKEEIEDLIPEDKGIVIHENAVKKFSFKLIFDKIDAVKTYIQEQLKSYAPRNHNHAGVYEPVFTKNSAFNKNFGNAAGTVCQGNDSRLSDARTPKAHNHDYVSSLECCRVEGDNVKFYPTHDNAKSNVGQKGYVGFNGANFLILKNFLNAVRLENKEGKQISFGNIYFTPVQTNEIYCGTSGNRWLGVFTKNAVDVSSDARLKHDIVSMSELPVTFETGENMLEQLFSKLNPTMFCLNSDDEKENDKIHMGFIAQDLSDAIRELGLEENDTAFLSHYFWNDEKTGAEKDTYGIAYTEFIALNTHMIKKCLSKINELQKEVDNLKKLIPNS